MSRSRGVTGADLLLVAAAYLVALLVVAGFPHLRAGFPLDDSWIHQVVARNLAHDGTLGFVPGVRSSGSSSLLWTVVLAANWKLLPVVSPWVYSGVVSAALLIAMGWGMLAMARRDGMPETACWIWALTPALDGNFMWLGLIGMEHLLFVVLSVMGVYLWFAGGRGSAWGAAVCLGLLALTRPEGLVLAGMALLAYAWVGRGRRDAGVLAGVVAVCVAVSLAANRITSNAWLPTTYAGRKWLYFGSDKVPPMAHLLFPYELLKGLLLPWGVRPTHPLYTLDAVVALAMAAGVWRLIAERRKRATFLVAWSFVHIAVYAAMLPVRSHGGRYQPLFLMLSFPLMFLGIEAALRRVRLSMTIRRMVLVGACLVCGVPSILAWRLVTAAGIALIEGTHAMMGRYLVETLPAGSKVAALDIGRMGYLYGGTLGDMGGLTDSAFLPYMREHRAWAYLQEQGVDYLVWPTTEEGYPDVPQILRFTPENRADMEELQSFCVPRALWFASYAVTTDAAPCQRLYRLRNSDGGHR